MKYLLYSIALILAPTLIALDGDDTTPENAAGREGVENDTCWKTRDNQHTVHVSVRGTVYGDNEVVITEGDDSGTTDDGVSDPQGGVSDSPPVTVGGERYRIRGGRVQQRDAKGTYRTMRKVKCPDEEEKPEENPTEEAPGDLAVDSVGTMPDSHNDH